MDFSPQQPIGLLQLRNQIAETGITGKTFDGRDAGTDNALTTERDRQRRHYFITEVVASAPATITYLNAAGDTCTRTVPTGRSVWTNPWGGIKIILPAEITEYSGFYVL